MDVEDEVSLGVTVIDAMCEARVLEGLREEGQKRPALHIPSCRTMQAVSAWPFAASRTKMHASPTCFTAKTPKFIHVSACLLVEDTVVDAVS